jgi:pimeloyl-ACP methyl ester carboxylesterase
MNTTALLLLLTTTALSATPAPPSSVSSSVSSAPSLAPSPIWASFPPVMAAPVRASWSTRSAPVVCPDDDAWVATVQTPSCVRIATHRPRRPSSGGGAPTLVVYLHADLYPVVLDSGFLRFLAGAAPQAVVVGMLRPGFRDVDGDETRAVGQHGFGDAYLRSDALVVGEAIAALKARHGARRVVVIGASGGAAIAANVAALSPGLVDDAVVASCPCDLASWREHRGRTSADAVAAARWQRPFRSLSPRSTASLVPATTRVTLIAGERDDNTPPAVHAPYLAALQAAGVDASLIVVHGSGHAVLDAPRARHLIRGVLAPSSSSLASPSLASAATGALVAGSAAVRGGVGTPSVRDAP